MPSVPLHGIIVIQSRSELTVKRIYQPLYVKESVYSVSPIHADMASLFIPPFIPRFDQNSGSKICSCGLALLSLIIKLKQPTRIHGYKISG